MLIQKRSLSSFWFRVLFVALSLGWLSPNHYAPWSAFHADAWVSAVLICATCTLLVVFRTADAIPVSSLACTAAAVMLIPLLQLVAGMHAFSGTAWMATAYLGGFLLALLVGAMWEKYSPDELVDGLFLAIVLASVVSVGLQLHQWLFLDRLFVWDMGNLSGRPYANFGQPNMLATFLLWGLLGLGWAVVRGRLSALVAVFVALYLLFGVALTGSRTGWISVTLIVCAAWYWRALSPGRLTPLVITGLAIYFAACVMLKGPVLELLNLEGLEDLIRVEGETRQTIWKILFKAALEKPFFGYGWNQIALAHTAVAADQPAMYVLLTQAHNVFLDLLLWCGIPLGLLLSGVLLGWLYKYFRTVKTVGDVLLLLLILVVGVHALLEFPLSYAYMLLPAGLIMGVLEQRLGKPALTISTRWPIWGLVASLSLLLGLITRDYLRVEASYLAFRFEQAQLRAPNSAGPPDVLLLDQLQAMITYFRFEPHKNMSVAELNWMRQVAALYPSGGIVHKLAAALAWNGQPDESRLWLQRLCKMVRPDECESVRRAWAFQSQTDPDIRAIPWPDLKQK